MVALDSATYLQHARVGIYDESCVCHAAISMLPDAVMHSYIMPTCVPPCRSICMQRGQVL